MASDRIDLAELYKFDEIYWIPADRPSIPSEASVLSEPEPLASQDVELPVATFAPQVEKETNSTQDKASIPSGPGLQASFVEKIVTEPTAPHEVSTTLPTVNCRLVVVGKINATEKERLQLVLSAAPVSLQANDWQILDPMDTFTLDEFVDGTHAQWYVFLGDQIPAWKEQLSEGKIISRVNKKVYHFPRLISSLKDSEKPLKLAFWNAMKEIVNG